MMMDIYERLMNKHEQRHNIEMGDPIFKDAIVELQKQQAKITRLTAIIEEMKQIDDVLAPSNNKVLFNELKLKSQMYEYVRRLNAKQFAEIYDINIKSGEHFDHLIIQAMRKDK